MAKSTFTSFGKELLRSWELFVRNWKPAVVFSLLPAIPLFLLLPYLIETNTFIVEELFIWQPDISTMSVVAGVIGVVAAFATWMLVRCCLFILFSQRKGGKEALQTGIRRYLPFLWTEILLMLFVFILALPTILFQWWYVDFGWPAILAQGNTAADILAYGAFTTLLIPPIIASMWFLFGPIGVALGKTRGGVSALRHSMEIVNGKWWKIFLRMAGLAITIFVIQTILAPLPFASWIVSFIISILLAAFLAVLYKQAQSKTI